MNVLGYILFGVLCVLFASLIVFEIISIVKTIKKRIADKKHKESSVEDRKE